MINKLKIYTITLAILFGIHGAALAESSDNKEALLDLINQIRIAPYSYAIEIGYDSEFLKERGILPETRFEPYFLDDFLSAGAEESNSAVVEVDTIPVEKEPVHLFTAETGGVVSFFNFMPVDTAFKIVIDNLFRNELDANDFTHILSPVYSDAGIAVKPGVLESRANAWFVTLTLGSSALISEVQLLNMINQARSNPLDMLEYTDKKLIDVFRENRDIIYLYGKTYPPLFFNTYLQASAKAYSFYVHNGVYPEDSGDTSIERGLTMDMMDSLIKELALVVPSEYGGIASLGTVFLSLMDEELKTWPRGGGGFSNNYQDAGLNLFVRDGEEVDVTVLSFVSGLAYKEDDQVSQIYGILFLDNDRDSFYSPGEEIVQETVMVYDEGMVPVKSVVTDRAGHFSIILDSDKRYFFKAEPKDSPIIQEIFIAGDQFVSLACTPCSFLKKTHHWY